MSITQRTVMFIIPDYKSHMNPLTPICHAFNNIGYHVVVATGPALGFSIEQQGFEYVELRLGEESNTGLISEQRRQQIARSIESTKRGIIAALTEQAEDRSHAFLWHAEEVAERTLDILADVQPDFVISVQLTFAATATLLAIDFPFATFVTGHPSQFPFPGDVYGYPYEIPISIRDSVLEKDLGELKQLCKAVQYDFTCKFNKLMKHINGSVKLVSNGLAAASSRLLLFNYPMELADDRFINLSVPVKFVGASVRNEELDNEYISWINHNKNNGAPIVYVAFGSYFSVRTDVLQRVIDSLKNIHVNVILATGIADIMRLSSIPARWLVQSYFPQVAILPYCDLVICHGGNNTVTESLFFGVPIIVAPFASDQFGSAFSVEKFNLGATFDPNHATIEEITEYIQYALELKENLKLIRQRLLEHDGINNVPQWCEKYIIDKS